MDKQVDKIADGPSCAVDRSCCGGKKAAARDEPAPAPTPPEKDIAPSSGNGERGSDTIKSPRVWITGLVGAAVACSACLVAPALLLVLGGGAAAVSPGLDPNWLGYAVVPFVLLAVGLGSYLWYRGRKTARA